MWLPAFGVEEAFTRLLNRLIMILSVLEMTIDSALEIGTLRARNLI